MEANLPFTNIQLNNESKNLVDLLFQSSNVSKTFFFMISQTNLYTDDSLMRRDGVSARGAGPLTQPVPPGAGCV